LKGYLAVKLTERLPGMTDSVSLKAVTQPLLHR